MHNHAKKFEDAVLTLHFTWDIVVFYADFYHMVSWKKDECDHVDNSNPKPMEV